MLELNTTVNNSVLKEPPGTMVGSRRFIWFSLLALVLIGLFHRDLLALVHYARSSDSNSYILLIPFFVGYLINLKRQEHGFSFGSPSRLGLIPISFAFVALSCSVILALPAPSRSSADQLVLPILSFVCFLAAAGFFVFGSEFMKSISYPSALLLLICPLPFVAVESIKMFLQWTSTFAAQGLFQIFRVPFIRDGYIFEVPGLTFKVAEECSGINSTLVLLIVSLVAGPLFLRSNWSRAILAMFVIPLAIARNAFRIFTLAMLCIHVDPSMINSPIHHKGGPIFFALSLIPFTLVMLGLRSYDRRKKARLLPGEAATSRALQTQ